MWNYSFKLDFLQYDCQVYKTKMSCDRNTQNLMLAVLSSVCLIKDVLCWFTQHVSKYRLSGPNICYC